MSNAYLMRCGDYKFNDYNIEKRGYTYSPIDNSVIPGVFGGFDLNFNSPITIGRNVSGLGDAFRNLQLFNQPIKITNNDFKTLANTFNNCHNFNQPINIPNGTINCRCTFFDCHNFNSDVHIFGNIYDVYGMFYNCYNFSSNVFIHNDIDFTLRYAISNMFPQRNNTYPSANIICKNEYLFNELSYFNSWNVINNNVKYSESLNLYMIYNPTI